jgi:hypothetical protein
MLTYASETWILTKRDRKQINIFERKVYRRILGPVYLRVKKQRNVLHEISKQKANWIGHILCRSCLLQQVIEGNIKGGIEVTGR